jgi:type I restriction enzyme M protein
VIQLPPDLFFGTGIQTCILVLKKSKKDNKVLFVNAERQFARFGNKNKLRPEDIQKILTTYTNRSDEDYFSRFVAHEEIKKNEYSLSVTNYISAEDTRETVDINVLNKSIKEILLKRELLRQEIDLIVANLEENK